MEVMINKVYYYLNSILKLPLPFINFPFPKSDYKHIYFIKKYIECYKPLLNAQTLSLH